MARRRRTRTTRPSPAPDSTPHIPRVRLLKRYWLVPLLTVVGGLGVAAWQHALREVPLERAGPPSLDQPERQGALDDASLLFGKAETVEQIEAEELRLAGWVETTFSRHEDTCFFLGHIYGLQGDTHRQIDLWQQAIDLNPQRADLYAKLAQLTKEQGDEAQAMAYWRQSLQLDPHNASALWDLANSLIESNQPLQAIPLLEQACAIDSGSIRNHYLLGQAYLEGQQYAEARVQFKKTIQLDPEHVNAHFGLARVFRFLQMPEEAKAALTRFRELKKVFDASLTEQAMLDDLSQYRTRLSQHHFMIYTMCKKSGQSDRGVPHLNRAIQLDPGNTGYLEALGVHFVSSQAYSRALAVYQRARQINPNQPLFAINIGKMHGRLRQYAHAERIYQQIIGEHSDFALAYAELARLYLKTQRHLPQTIGLAQKAVAIQANATNYFLLSWAHDVNGHYEQALQAIQQAMALAPHNENYRKVHERIQQKL